MTEEQKPSKGAADNPATQSIESAAQEGVKRVTEVAVAQTSKTNAVARLLLSTVFWRTMWRLLSLIVLAGFLYVLGKALFFGDAAPALKLDDGQYMRGLITMLLVFVVLALIIVMILTALFAEDDESTSKRIGLSREVITPLLGILGTIIGFYFGAATVSQDKKTTLDTATMLSRSSGATAITEDSRVAAAAAAPVTQPALAPTPRGR